MRRLGELLLLACVFCIVLEGTCRLEDWVRFQTPILSPFAAEEDLVVRDARGAHARANARYGKYVIDSLGMRGPDAPLVAAPGTVRVVTEGASETFGLYESPGQEYPRQLADSLTRWFRTDETCAPRRAEVLNAAVFGMSLPTVEQDLRLRVSRLHPDVVVIYPTPVQYLNDTRPVATPPDSAPRSDDVPVAWSWRPRILGPARDELKAVIPASMLDWWHRRVVDQATAARPADWRFDAVPADRLADYESDLRRVIGTVRAIGATPVIMTHANRFMAGGDPDPRLMASWLQFYPRATASTVLAFDEQAAAVTRRVAADSGVVVADLAAAVGAMGRGAGVRFADYAHFSDAGSSAVAAVLTPAVATAIGCPIPRAVGGTIARRSQESGLAAPPAQPSAAPTTAPTARPGAARHS
jgi:hypothetical protein